MVVIMGLLAAVAFWLLYDVLQSRSLAFVVVFIYLAVTIVEKWAYGNAVLRYKNLIRKLVDRVEELEREQDREPGS